jgi:acyl carrier protein
MKITVEDAVSAVREVMLNKGQSGVEVTEDTVLRDLLFDSLDLAEVFIILEDKAGGELPGFKLGRLERVGDFVNTAAG